MYTYVVHSRPQMGIFFFLPPLFAWRWRRYWTCKRVFCRTKWNGDSRNHLPTYSYKWTERRLFFLSGNDFIPWTATTNDSSAARRRRTNEGSANSTKEKNVLCASVRLYVSYTIRTSVQNTERQNSLHIVNEQREKRAKNDTGQALWFWLIYYWPIRYTVYRSPDAVDVREYLCVGLYVSVRRVLRISSGPACIVFNVGMEI